MTTTQEEREQALLDFRRRIKETWCRPELLPPMTRAQRELELKRAQDIRKLKKEQERQAEEARRLMKENHAKWVLSWVEHILGTGFMVLWKLDKETALTKWREAGLRLEGEGYQPIDPLAAGYPYKVPSPPFELMYYNGDVVAFFCWSNGSCSKPVRPAVDVAVQ